MLKVEFNANEARATLRRAKQKLGDLSGLHDIIRQYLLSATLTRFKTETDPDGKRWAPKAQSTIAFYERQGLAGLSKTRTLYKSGKLGHDIVSFADRNAVIIGSNAKYSGVMQDGAAKGAFGRDRRGRPVPWGTIPARRWLGISIFDEREIVQLADDYMQDILASD